MLSLGSDRLHARIDEAIRTRGNGSLGWRFYVDGEDYSDEVGEGGYTHEEGPAIALNVEVSGRPENLEGSEVLLEWHVSDDRGTIPVYAYTGQVSKVERNILSSQVKSSTPGADIDSTELGQRIEYGGVNPSTAVADALNRVTRYRVGLVRVERIEEPKFTRQGQDAYSKTDMAGNVLEAVQSEVEALTVYDTPDGGCIASLEPSLESTPEPVWTFDVNDIEEFDDGSESDSFREVGVRRQIQNPQPGTDPWEVLKRVEVPNSTAPIGTIKWIDVSDNTQEALESAFRQAREEASVIAYGRGSISFTALYVHPRLLRGDPVAVLREDRDSRGRYVEKFLCILSKADCPEIRKKKGKYAGVARVVETVRVEEPASLLPGLSAGIGRPTYGLNVSGTEMYFEEGIGWVSVDGDELVFSDPAPVTVSGDELVVSR